MRSERPLAYLAADVASPLIIAVLWVTLPFDASTSARWIGGIALALVAPIDQLARRRLSTRWTNYALLCMRCAVSLALVVAVPIMWHPGAITIAVIIVGALAVESIPRMFALAVASLAGLVAAALIHDVSYWYLSVAIAAIMFFSHGAWYRAWGIERSEVELRHDEMVDRAPMFSWEVETSTGTVLSMAGNVEEVLGWSAYELVGESVGKVVDLAVEREILRDELALRTGERHAVVTARHKDGHHVTLREVRLASRRTGVVRGVSIDITELANATEALRHQAEHDALTGLANRTVVEKKVDAALRERGTQSLVLVVADLDRFKEINDTLGHPTGDRVLRVLADRLSSGLSDLAVVARLGGDEFAFVAIGDYDQPKATALAHRVHALITESVAIDSLELAVACSIGVALAPDHGETYPDLLKRADIATYQAKRSGGGVRVFESTPDDLSIQRLQLISEASSALDRGEFELYFQPQVDLATGQIVGVEGLARWNHPTLGLLAPGRFLSVIEVAADYRRFANEMLRQAVEFSAAASEVGSDLQVAVNIGSRSFVDQRLPRTVEDLLTKHGVDPSTLTLEVTESDLLEDQTGDGPIFSALEVLGVRLSIDDFGTGYSTFTRLRRLNVDEVKIDREFVQGLDESEEDYIIVRATVRLAQLLGLDVVAEGVETVEQLAWLQRFGCPSAQGFLWSKAVPRDELLTMLRDDHRFAVNGAPDTVDLPEHFVLDAVVREPLLDLRSNNEVVAALKTLFSEIAERRGPHGVVVRDIRSRVVEANEAFRGFLGDELFEQLIGTTDQEFADGTHAGSFAGEAFTLSRTRSADGFRLTLALPDRTLKLRTTTTGLVDAEGRRIGLVIIHRIETPLGSSPDDCGPDRSKADHSAASEQLTLGQ